MIKDIIWEYSHLDHFSKVIFGDLLLNQRFCYDVSSRYIQYIVDDCEVKNTFLRVSFWVLPGCQLELWRLTINDYGFVLFIDILIL